MKKIVCTCDNELNIYKNIKTPIKFPLKCCNLKVVLYSITILKFTFIYFVKNCLKSGQCALINYNKLKFTLYFNKLS